MHVELPPGGGIGDEGAELGVFDRDLSEADGIGGAAVAFEESLEHAVKADLGRVGNVAEKGVRPVAADFVEHRGNQGAAEVFALLVDFSVVAA